LKRPAPMRRDRYRIGSRRRGEGASPAPGVEAPFLVQRGGTRPGDDRTETGSVGGRPPKAVEGRISSCEG